MPEITWASPQQSESRTTDLSFSLSGRRRPLWASTSTPSYISVQIEIIILGFITMNLKITLPWQWKLDQEGSGCRTAKSQKIVHILSPAPFSEDRLKNQSIVYGNSSNCFSAVCSTEATFCHADQMGTHKAYMQCFLKWNLVLRTSGQKLFNGEKKDFWVK